MIGGTLYAGAGIGIYYSDGNWADEPFYMLRAGLDFPILPFLYLDINANYRAGAFDELDEAESDAITLGVSARFSF